MDIFKMFDELMKEEQKDVTNLTAFFLGETDRLNRKKFKRNMHRDYARGFSSRHVLEEIKGKLQ
jgi:hypothetical protein